MASSGLRPWIAAVTAATLVLAGCLAEGDVSGRGASTGPESKPSIDHRLVTNPQAALDLLGVRLGFTLVDVGVGAPEPTIGVTSKGTVFMIAGTDVLKSTDHGRTWTNVAPQVPGTGANIPPTTLDPMLWVDPVTDRVFYNHLYLGCTYMATSDDEGATWIPNPVACGLPVVDHQTIAAGPTGLPAPLYQGRALYFCANQLFDATCAISLDGGRTFPITRPVFGSGNPGVCGGLHGHVNIAPDGTVYLPAWRCDEPWVGVSRDDGLTWAAQRVAGQLSSGEADPAAAVDAANNAYYFWVDKQGQPFLSRSTDGGRSWSPALDVAFEGLMVANLPTIVAGSEGRIAFAYIGTTEGEPVNPAQVDPETRWNLYVTLSLDALAETPAFATVQLNDSENPIHVGRCTGGYRCGAIVDFMDITIGPDGRVYVASTDSGGTRNGVVGVLLEGPSLFEERGFLDLPPSWKD